VTDLDQQSGEALAHDHRVVGYRDPQRCHRMSTQRLDAVRQPAQARAGRVGAAGAVVGHVDHGPAVRLSPADDHRPGVRMLGHALVSTTPTDRALTGRRKSSCSTPRAFAADDLAALRELVTNPDGGGVLAGASRTTEEPRTVLQQRSTMTCEKVELNSVRAFSRNWLEPILG